MVGFNLERHVGTDMFLNRSQNPHFVRFRAVMCVMLNLVETRVTSLSSQSLTAAEEQRSREAKALENLSAVSTQWQAAYQSVSRSGEREAGCTP